MESKTVANGILMPCCANPRNRTTIADNGIMKTEQCACGRKHHTLYADPGKLGVILEGRAPRRIA